MQETPFVKTSEQKPPLPGWYKTRRSLAPNMLQPQRRWWSGAGWSLPAFLEDTNDWARRQGCLSAETVSEELGEIEWCGLAVPHPEWNLHWEEVAYGKPL